GRKMARDGTLGSRTVVGTVMSNFGLERALYGDGVTLVRTEVGDPAVVREMRAKKYTLGGDQSGHVIFLNHATTGDGLLTMLKVLAQVVQSAQPLHELRAMTRVPQILENVRVRQRVPFAEM